MALPSWLFLASFSVWHTAHNVCFMDALPLRSALGRAIQWPRASVGHGASAANFQTLQLPN